MVLRRASLEDFNKIAEQAHLITFDEYRPNTINTYDFALLAEDDAGIPLGYIACFEFDKESVWVLHGGVFPNTRKSMRAAQVFHKAMNYLRENYKRVKLDTRNDNIAMIKLAYSAGFKIMGVEQQHSGLYLAMGVEFEQ